MNCYDSAGRISWVAEEDAQANADRASCTNGQAPTYDNAYASNVLYWPHGALGSLQFGNGLWEWTNYSSERLQPEDMRLGATLGGSEKWRLENGYGTAGANNGNVRTQTLHVPTLTQLDLTYTYDNVNRLDSATEKKSGVQTWTQSYGYDRWGNRTATNSPNPSLTPGSFDPATNRINDTTGAGYGYDLAGNLENYQGRALIYDAENRQKSLTDQGTTFTYAYDGQGKRVKKVTPGGKTVYVYDAFGALAAEYSEVASTESGTQYLTGDHLGSTRVVTDASGQVVRRYDYLPYGEEIPGGWGGRSAVTDGLAQTTYQAADWVNPKFTGQVRDYESGLNLDYFGARYLSGAMGMWLSADAPFVDQHATNPQSWNLYGYARNNPLGLVDDGGRATKLPQVPGHSRYTYRYDAQGYDNPNFHIFKNGKEIGRIQVDEVSTGRKLESGKIETRRGVRVSKGKIPPSVLESMESLIDKKNILPRYSLQGRSRPFRGFTVRGGGALFGTAIVSGIVADYFETRESGILTTVFGTNKILDPAKAARSLGEGQHIIYTDKSGKSQFYEVRNGQIVRSGCNPDQEPCGIPSPSEGSFTLPGPWI